MEDEILEIIEDLIQQLYEARGFDTFSCNPFERDIFEAEMKEKYLMVQSELEDVVSAQQYRKDIEDLEERLTMSENEVTDLINRNYDLAEERDKYWNRIQEISKVVNDTWS